MRAVVALHRPPGHSGHCPACHRPAVREPCPTVAALALALTDGDADALRATYGPEN